MRPGLLGLVNELHRLRRARQWRRFLFADQRAAAAAAAQRFGIQADVRGLALESGRLQDDGDRHFLLRLRIGSGDDLGGQVDGPRGPHADRIDLRAELLGRSCRVGTGGLVEVAEDDQAGQAARTGCGGPDR